MELSFFGRSPLRFVQKHLRQKEGAMKQYLSKVFSRQSLSQEEAESAMDLLMQGEASSEEVCGLLGALRGKGESIDEIVGFARSMRKHAVPLQVQRRDLVDTCGTGGDGADTFNISTASCFILAASGLGVVKHGNRAVSSKCGSADVLESLSVKIDRPVDLVVKDVESFGFAFLFAPLFHPAMKHVGPARRALGVRTVFNLLGPLVNPAGARRQVIGCYDSNMLETLAKVLQELGSEEVMLVSGTDGLDEISVTATTHVVHLKDGAISKYVISPEDLGVERATLADLKGGDAKHNAQLIEGILSGQIQGPKRDIVTLNAAAALMVAGKAENLVAGYELANQIVDQGKAMAVLQAIRGEHAKV